MNIYPAKNDPLTPVINSAALRYFVSAAKPSGEAEFSAFVELQQGVLNLVISLLCCIYVHNDPRAGPNDSGVP